jgi:hypothetical protein
MTKNIVVQYAQTSLSSLFLRAKNNINDYYIIKRTDILSFSIR